MSEPARVLAWISEAKPWGEIDPPESPVERAAQSALLAVADFYIAVQQLKTVDEALKLHRIIEQVELSVGSASRAALERADALCGGNAAKEQ